MTCDHVGKVVKFGLSLRAVLCHAGVACQVWWWARGRGAPGVLPLRGAAAAAQHTRWGQGRQCVRVCDTHKAAAGS